MPAWEYRIVSIEAVGNDEYNNLGYRLLYDDGSMDQLMEETRCYVETQGIQRTETGGWRFPVVYRQATVLSKYLG
jgi:hypothetical protein